MVRSPKETSTGWVFIDRPAPAEGFLILFAGFLTFLLLVFGLIGGISWVSSGSLGAQPTVAVLVLGVLLGLIVFAWRSTAGATDDWHPLEISLSAWPVEIGEPILIQFEQRRKQPVAAPPTLSAELLLRKREYRRDGPDRTRTQESAPVTLIDQRDLEPVKARFELLVPTEWDPYVSSSEFSFELVIWRSFEDSGIGSTFPLEVVA